MRGVKAAHRASEEFKSEDWLLDTVARSWTNLGKKVILLERSENTTRQVLHNKLMMNAAKARLPSEATAQAHVDEIQGAKNAMQSRMAEEKELKLEKING